MANEMIDIFDANYNHIGVKDKYSVRKEGLWHQIFRCWIISPNGKIVVQLRGKDKKIFPNVLDTSAAGYLAAGEKPENGIREINEELGLNVQPTQLLYLGKFVDVYDYETKVGVSKGRSFMHIFFHQSDIPLNQYKLQPEEVDGVFEVEIQDGLKLFSNEVKNINIVGFLRQDGTNELILDHRMVSYDDFMPEDKSYFLKIFIMAERLLEGKKYLAV